MRSSEGREARRSEAGAGIDSDSVRNRFAVSGCSQQPSKERLHCVQWTSSSDDVAASNPVS